MTSLRRLSLGLGLTAGLALPALAVPITIDFEGATPGTITNDTLVVAVSGPNGPVNVTFEGVGLQFVQFTSPFVSNRVLATFPAPGGSTTTDTSSPAITVTLDGGLHFLSASVQNVLFSPGGVTSEFDRIVITAFNSGIPIPGGSITGTANIIGLTALDADLINIDDVPGPNGAEPFGFVIGEFTFEIVPDVIIDPPPPPPPPAPPPPPPVASVPEPGSMAALAAGLVLLASRRRRGAAPIKR